MTEHKQCDDFGVFIRFNERERERNTHRMRERDRDRETERKRHTHTYIHKHRKKYSRREGQTNHTRPSTEVPLCRLLTHISGTSIHTHLVKLARLHSGRRHFGGLPCPNASRHNGWEV